MVLQDLKHRKHYIVLSLDEVISRFSAASSEVLAAEPNISPNINKSQYSNIGNIKYLVTQYYKAIEYCYNQGHVHIIDFGCGTSIGEFTFKNMFENTNMTFESWARTSNSGNNDYYNAVALKLGITPKTYNGNINEPNFNTVKSNSPVDAIICFRLIIENSAIDNFYKNNMANLNTEILYTYKSQHPDIEDFRVVNPVNKTYKVL